MTKNTTQRKTNRKAGVLMPVSSLPSPFGIGTLGAGAYSFIDWLFSAGIKIWQVLPLLPTGYGDSPYQSCASDALNYYFIDFALLEEEGLLEKKDYKDIAWSKDERRVDYGTQFENKTCVLLKAYERMDKTNADWQTFLACGKYRDFALFMSLKRKFHYQAWTEWDEPYRNAERNALARFEQDNADEIGFWQFTQYVFLKQWNALKDYAHAKGVEIMGDMPIYVSADSVESWKYREELFMLDGEESVEKADKDNAVFTLNNMKSKKS